MVRSYVLRSGLNARPGLEKGKYPSFELDCPSCGKEQHVSMRESSGKWHCFHCMAGGTFASFISLVERIPFNDAVIKIKQQDLSRGTGGDVTKLDAIMESAEEDADLVTCSLPPDMIYLRTHPYLESRLVSPEETQRHHFGMCVTGYYRGRIIIPIFERGDPVGFVARDFTGTPTFGRKILNPTISMSMMVWNLDTTLKHKRIVACEGVFSALRAGDDAVALFGKNFARYQAYKLRDNGVKELVLMFDSDVDLWSSTLPHPNNPKLRLRNPMPEKLSFLSSLFLLRIVELQTGDPGEHPRDYLRNLVETAPLYQGVPKLLISL